MNVPSMCTGSPRKSGTCCEPSGGLGARNPLGQPLGPPGAHFLDGERVQRHFSATRKANGKTVNTGDLELVATVSWPHTLHFVAHTQSPGALWWSCGWALRTCTRLPFWYSLLFFLLLLLSLSIAFWVWLWLVLTVIIAELPFPTRPFINKYLDRENSGVNEAANA